jgi:hypothetical protein
LLEGEADLKEAVATVEAQLKPALYYLDNTTWSRLRTATWLICKSSQAFR